MRKTICFAAALLLGGCGSATYTLTGVAVGNQTASMDQGAAAVQSAWATSIVTVKPIDADLSDNLALWVQVANTSGRAADFGTENVEVSYDGQTWLPVESYEQLKARLDNEATGAKVATVLLTGLGAWAASRSGHYTETGVVATPFGVGAYQVHGVDYAARQANIDNVVGAGIGTMAAIDDAHDDAVARLKARILRTTTVPPQEMFGGVVIADAPKIASDRATPVLVRVSFNGDAHVIQFQAHRPGVAPIPAVDVSASPALAVEAAHSIASDAAPVSAAAARPSGAVLAVNATLPMPASDPAPACTQADRDMATLAKKNGFAYHATCE